MDFKFRAGSLIFPVVLIVAGVVFLLNNLGVLEWSVWVTLWRLWPIVLIGFGLDVLIGGRFRWGSVAVALILLVTLSGGVWFSVLRGPVLEPAGIEMVHARLDGAGAAEVDIDSSVSVLHITDTSEADILVTGQVERSLGEEIRQESSVRNGQAYYRLRSDLFRSIPNRRQDTGARWDLQLTNQAPLDLRITTGVAKAELDLTNLNLSRLRVAGGVGHTTLSLPKTGQFTAKLDVGVGALTVYIPKEMAARIRLQTGLSSRSVSGDYIRDGDYYISPGYDTAENRVELEIHSGVSRVEVKQR